MMIRNRTDRSDRTAVDVPEDAFRVEFDDSSPVGAEVVTAVASLEGVDETSLPALNDVVDPDALTAIFGDRPNGASRTGGRVCFDYAGYRVFVTSDGHIFLSS